MRRLWVICLSCSLIVLWTTGWFASPSSAPLSPHIFFSDITSGPNIGGQNGQGAYVTIRGKRFGASQGNSYVTVGGQTASSYPIWTDSRITFQLSSSARSGLIVVHAQGGSVESNGIPFTIRPGRIFCVSTSGSDRNNGTFAQGCWASLYRARSAMKAGDITYAEDGVSEAGNDPRAYSSQGESLTVRDWNGGGAHSATPSDPIAFVAYPGATVTVGNPNKGYYGVRLLAAYWVLAGFKLRSVAIAVQLWSHDRLVNNDISCPRGDGYVGCVLMSQATDVKLFGNNVHDVCALAPCSKMYHSVYATTDSNDIDIGWNTIGPDKSCRAIQFHSSPVNARTGYDQYGIFIHDNIIHDNPCDGINLATVDPSKGPVEVYNNIIYNTGKGPMPPDGTASYAAIYSAGMTNRGKPGAGDILVYNNTLYNNGSGVGQPGISASTAGALAANNWAPNLIMKLVNNIIAQRPNEAYYSLSTSVKNINGTNNLWSGSRVQAAPSFTANNILRPPHFVDRAARDFHLMPGSPAIGAGVNTGVPTGRDGILRPRDKPYDLGAYQVPDPSAPASQTLYPPVLQPRPR